MHVVILLSRKTFLDVAGQDNSCSENTAPLESGYPVGIYGVTGLAGHACRTRAEAID